MLVLGCCGPYGACTPPAAPFLVKTAIECSAARTNVRSRCAFASVEVRIDNVNYSIRGAGTLRGQEGRSWPNWCAIVTSIQSGGEEAARAEHELCQHSGWLRQYLKAKNIGNHADIEEVVQDTLFATILNIRKGQVREPQAIPAIMKTIANRRALRILEKLIQERDRDAVSESDCAIADPVLSGNEAQLFTEDIRARALQGLKEHERNILIRAFAGQSNRQICAEMSLTENQCRNLKSRAKKRFIEFGRDLLQSGTDDLASTREDVLKRRRVFRQRLRADSKLKAVVLRRANALLEDPAFRERLNSDPQFLSWLLENIGRFQEAAGLVPPAASFEALHGRAANA